MSWVILTLACHGRCATARICPVISLLTRSCPGRCADAGSCHVNGWSTFAYGVSKIGVTVMTQIQQHEMDQSGHKSDILINSVSTLLCCPCLDYCCVVCKYMHTPVVSVSTQLFRLVHEYSSGGLFLAWEDFGESSVIPHLHFAVVVVVVVMSPIHQVWPKPTCKAQ